MSSVDVVIPCYRYGCYLRNCVESALTQGGVDVRVLILDDCSPDETPEVGAQLAREDPRVQYRRHAANRGHIATYNEGLDWCEGDYTLLLSADDRLTPGAFARAVRVMDRHPEVGLLFGREIIVRPGEGFPAPASTSHACPYRIVSSREFLETTCRVAFNLVPPPTALARTSVHHAVGRYRKELPHTADVELWLRFGARAPVAVLDAEQAYYRRHGRNMSEDSRGVLDLENRKKAFDSFFRHEGRGGGDAERLQRLANDVMASEAFWTAYHDFERGDARRCQAYLAFAAAADPSVRCWPAWSNLRRKRLLGPRLWSLARPIVDFLRGAPRSAAAAATGEGEKDPRYYPFLRGARLLHSADVPSPQGL